MVDVWYIRIISKVAKNVYIKWVERSLCRGR